MNARFVIVAMLGGWLPAAGYGRLTGELGAHDPSTVVRDGGVASYFATGKGIVSRGSPLTPQRSNSKVAESTWPMGGSNSGPARAWRQPFEPGWRPAGALAAGMGPPGSSPRPRQPWPRAAADSAT